MSTPKKRAASLSSEEEKPKRQKTTHLLKYKKRRAEDRTIQYESIPIPTKVAVHDNNGGNKIEVTKVEIKKASLDVNFKHVEWNNTRLISRVQEAIKGSKILFEIPYKTGDNRFALLELIRYLDREEAEHLFREELEAGKWNYSEEAEELNSPFLLGIDHATPLLSSENERRRLAARVTKHTNTNPHLATHYSSKNHRQWKS